MQLIPGLLALVPGLNANFLALVPGLDAKKLASKPGTINHQSNIAKGFFSTALRTCSLSTCV